LQSRGPARRGGTALRPDPTVRGTGKRAGGVHRLLSHAALAGAVCRRPVPDGPGGAAVAGTVALLRHRPSRSVTRRAGGVAPRECVLGGLTPPARPSSGERRRDGRRCAAPWTDHVSRAPGRTPGAAQRPAAAAAAR